MSTTVPEAIQRTRAYQDQVRDADAKAIERERAAARKRAGVGAPTIPAGFKQMRIEVYVCPTPECIDYFGHTGMPDLGSRFTSVMTEERHREPGDPTRGPGIPAGERHTRAECPSCRSRGVLVERVRAVATVLVPLQRAHG